MKRLYTTILVSVLCSACSKSYVEVDPATGQELSTLSSNVNGSCEIIGFRQISGTVVYNMLSCTKDSSGMPIELSYKDSTTKTQLQAARFMYKQDTVYLGDSEWVLLEKSTKNVLQYYKRIVYPNNSLDEEMNVYQYDKQNRLEKKHTYYNKTILPDYTSIYQYNNDNNLVGSTLTTGDGKVKLLQTSIRYDATKKIKPWLYVFGDAFENTTNLVCFKFGQKPVNPIAEMVTEIFDAQNGSVLEKWTTTFSGYVISKDGYVLQVSCNGDVQQGWGMYAGDMRFDYRCN